MRRHAWTIYLSTVGAVGFLLLGLVMLFIPELPVASPPGPTVTITTYVPAGGGSSGPAAPGVSASATGSSGAAPVGGVPSPHLVLVGVSPSAGLPPTASSGPSSLPAPSASGSGSGPTSSPSPSASASSSPSASSAAAVSLVVGLTPTIGVGLLGATLAGKL